MIAVAVSGAITALSAAGDLPTQVAGIAAIVLSVLGEFIHQGQLGAVRAAASSPSNSVTPPTPPATPQA